MGNIEAYLSGAIEYDALTDAERCAICAAMEGGFCENPEPDVFALQWFDGPEAWNGANWYYARNYLRDGTAALRMVEQFRMDVIYDYEPDRHFLASPCDEKGFRLDIGENDWQRTPAAAIVSGVCHLAQAQWPYKVTP